MGLNAIDNMAAAATDPNEERGAVMREAYPNLLPGPKGSPRGRNSGKGKAKNKLKPDDNASGDHTVFERDNNGNIYKYETYEKTKTGHNNPVKRFDGGKPDGSPGQPHTNKKTKVDVPTPHVQGKTVPDGARPAKPDEIPNNKRFNNGG